MKGENRRCAFRLLHPLLAKRGIGWSLFACCLTLLACHKVSTTQASGAKLFDSPETWSLPVFSRGLLYINQNYQDMTEDKPTRLLCYDLRGE
jgi:hypothetical protein